MTIADYLALRLIEQGAKTLFGIPGTSCSRFFDAAIRNQMRIVINSSELEAGYAADGYARKAGLAVVSVSYGVGVLSLTNAIAGALVERSPVVVVNGGPTVNDLWNEEHRGVLFSHSTGRPQTDLKVFREITAFAARAKDAPDAVRIIDWAVATAVREKRPVYIEIPSDLWAAPCDPPSDSLEFRPVPSGLESAIAAETIGQLRQATRPIVLLGVEVARYGLQAAAAEFLDRSGLPYATTLLAKSVLPENRPGFVGVYDSDLAEPVVRDMVEHADCILALGCVFGVDHTLLLTQAYERIILAHDDGIRFGSASPRRALLGYFLKELIAGSDKPSTHSSTHGKVARDNPQRAAQDVTDGLTFDELFALVNKKLPDDWELVVDTCLGSYPAADISRRRENSFVGNPVWLSIGHSVGAAIGVALASNRQVLVICGDGGFQMVSESLSTIAKYRLPVTIMVVDNGIYAIEQYLINPVYFRDPAQPALDYVRLNRWDYCGLAKAMGIERVGVANSIATLGPLLDDAIDRASSGLISAVVKSRDLPAENKRTGNDERHLARLVATKQSPEATTSPPQWQLRFNGRCFLPDTDESHSSVSMVESVEAVSGSRQRTGVSATRLVVQKGRSFQRANPDVKVLVDRGRFLVVDLPDGLVFNEEPGCFAVVPPDVRLDVSTSTRRQDEEDPRIRTLVERVTASKLREQVVELSAIHNRNSLQPGFQTALDICTSRLEAAGCTVQQVEVAMHGGSTFNLVAERRGSRAGPGLYLIGAHLDSVNHEGTANSRAPGADDNGSGSATVLAIAEAIADQALEHDVRFLLFGGEEQGLFGSLAFVSALSATDRSRLGGMVNIDMAASKNTANASVLLEGANVSRDLIDQLQIAAGTYTDLEVQVSLNPFASDHVPFINAGLPALLAIEGADSAYPHEHTERDTVDRLDFELHRQITAMIVAWIAGRAI